MSGGSLKQIAKGQAGSAVVHDDTWVPTMCWYCTKGPCPISVHRVNGVAVSVKGNHELPDKELVNNHGHTCAKPFGYIQKLYNPNRVKKPLKRTNPEKGVGVDPQWVEISWDEALDLVARKLKEVRTKDPRETKVGLCLGVGRFGTGGTHSAFWGAYGPFFRMGGGASMRCHMAEHAMGNQFHGGFQCEPDLERCDYLIHFGANPSAAGGAPESWQYADAYARGMKNILVDPVLSVSGAKADEWLPIKPATDVAFLLAMIQVILNEIGRVDTEFLQELTNSVYLVGTDGYFVRDRATGKVQVWDSRDNRAKAYDDDSISFKDLALEGVYTVDGAECRPSFQVLKEHMRQYTPEWAAKITEIPAATIRRIAREFVEHARIGSTITIDGLTLPYRPVATRTGRGITGNMRSYQFILANHILACLVGSLEVAGGHMGGRAEAVPLYQKGHYIEGGEGGRRGAGTGDGGVYMGEDGMKEVEAFDWVWPPISFDAMQTLVPYSKKYGHMAHLAYRNLVDPPPNLPMPNTPQVLFALYGNPLLSMGEPELVAEALKKIPFTVVSAYILNELSEFADVILPDRSELEKLEPVYWVRSALGKKYYHGRILRQPVVEPLYGIPDISDMYTDLAERVGMLDEYNAGVNNCFSLEGSFQLEPGKKYPVEAIADRHFKSVTKGERDLAWYQKHGATFEPTTVQEQFDVHLKVKREKIRYNLPYFEHAKRTGEKLAKNLASVGIDWWPTVEYVPLPIYLPSVVEEGPPEYDLYVTMCRMLPFAFGTNADIPWLIELGNSIFGGYDILMNEDTAKARGIKEGDEICVESEVGKVKHKVKLAQGIRPDTVLIAGQFGHWASPVARDTGRVSQTTLTPIRHSWTDPMTSSMQSAVVKAKVYKA